MKINVFEKILWFINSVILFFYCFICALIYLGEKNFGQISLYSLKSFSCQGCLDAWGEKIGCQFFVSAILFSLAVSWFFRYCLKKFYKDQDSYCPVALFVVYLFVINAFLWKFLAVPYQWTFSHQLIVFVLAAFMYFVNLHRKYDAKYIFLLLVMLFPAIVIYCAEKHPLLFYSYKGMAEIQDLSNVSMKNKRNLIVVYVESFNDMYSKTTFQSKNYELNDKEAFKFDYFKQGVDQDATKLALAASFTGSYLAYAMPQKSIGVLTKQQGYSNLFVQSGDIGFAKTKEFLLEGGFDEDDIFGMDKIPNTEICKIKKESGLKKIISETDLWGGTCDKATFGLFKEKISSLNKKKPFFAVMFTLDMHSGNIPFNEDFEEIKAENIENLNDFIAWFEGQEFYDNTTLIILADHSRFRSGDKSTLPLYNAFFNLPEDLKSKLTTNRIFNQTDMFLTMLEIMGFDLPTTQVGFSTSLFSKQKTLAEKYSNDELINKDGVEIGHLLKKSFVIIEVLKEMTFILVNNLPLLWK